MGWENVKSYKGIKKYVSSKHRYEGKPDECYYIYMKVNGKARNIKVGWKSEGYTAKQANEIRNDKVKNLRHGIPEQTYITIDEIWNKIKNKFQHRKDSQSFYGRYYLHIKPLFGHKLASEIQKEHLDELCNNLLSKNYAESSVKHVLQTFKNIYTTAKGYGIYNGKNPFEEYKPPKLQGNNKVRYLSYDEAELLLGELYKYNINTYYMALLSLHTGARLGDCVNLKWEHLNYENNLIYFAKRKGGKTGHAYMTSALKEAFQHIQTYNQSEYVFPDMKEDKTHPKNFRHIADRLFNKGTSRMNRVTFHTLRHTFASWLVLQGTPLYHVSKLLGHSSIQMTERYAHLSPDDGKSEVQKMFENNGSEDKPKGRVVNFG